VTWKTVVIILKFPTIEKEVFSYNIIKPVTQDKRAINSNVEKIVMSSSQIFAVPKACEKVNNIFICNQKNLYSILEDDCLSNIIHQKNATCDFYNTHTPRTRLKR
jgi:Gypsy protein